MFVATILIGGTGSRLYPLSTSNNPKQFLKLTDSKYSMFQLTINRIKKLNVDKINIICNEKHYEIAYKQFSELNLGDIKSVFITEPIGRNTAPAICITTLLNPDSNILVVPSDHVFDDDEFETSVCKGMSLVESGIVTFGIKPTYPESGYGYINYKDNDIVKFVEKPSKEVAESYLKEGNYAWNSGVFLFNSEIMKKEFITHCSDIYDNIVQILKSSTHRGELLKIAKDDFEKVREESIDYGIMEYHKNGKIIEYNGKWSDIGSFKSLYDEMDKDSNNNVINKNESDICTINTTNCYVNCDRGKIGLIGLKDLVVVKTKDTILISDINKSQEVKKLVFENREHVNEPVLRPWGQYVSIEGSDYCGFKVKKITVKPGKRLSLQSHNFRAEHWVVSKGIGKMQLNDTFNIMKVDDYVYIPIKSLHRMENIGTDDLVFIETQIGSNLSESDIIRYQDDFGRS